LNDKLKVRKSNILVEGRYRFNLNEQKVLLLLLAQLKPTDTEFKPYRVSWADLKQVTSGKVNTVKKVHAVCEALKNKTVFIRDGKKEMGFGFLSGWTVEQGKYIEFRIDPCMTKMLLDLLSDGNFTLYDLECVLSLNSSYSIRIYEILKSHYWKKQPVTVSLDSLKFALDISKNNKTYSDFGSFRRAILDKARNDLKQHTDITFTYTTIKDGRRITALLITVRENKKFQRTVQGKSDADQIKKTLKAGDIIILAGKEYEFNGSAIMLRDGALPVGRINELLKAGKAKVKV